MTPKSRRPEPNIASDLLISTPQEIEHNEPGPIADPAPPSHSSQASLTSITTEPPNRPPMKIDTKLAILEGARFLTAAQVIENARLYTYNPAAQTNKWKKRGLVFAVNFDGANHFPEYAFGSKDGRPIEALAAVIKILSPSKSDWEMALWFGSLNDFLGGVAPKRLLATQPNRVIAAAQDETRKSAIG